LQQQSSPWNNLSACDGRFYDVRQRKIDLSVQGQWLQHDGISVQSQIQSSFDFGCRRPAVWSLLLPNSYRWSCFKSFEKQFVLRMLCWLVYCRSYFLVIGIIWILVAEGYCVVEPNIILNPRHRASKIVCRHWHCQYSNWLPSLLRRPIQ
jgi:hypothetical protein